MANQESLSDYGNLVLAVAHSDLISQVRDNFRPLLHSYNGTTVGWLRSALVKGEIANVGTDEVTQLSADGLLALRRDSNSSASCALEPGRVTVTAKVGDVTNWKSGTDPLVCIERRG